MTRWRAVSILVIILSLSFTAFAADNAGMNGGGPFMQWNVKSTGHAGLELTVLDPEGNVIVKKFSGNNAMIKVSDLGANPVDGQYNYSLRVVPNVSASVQARLNAARENGDDAEIKKIQKEAKLGNGEVYSGTITLLNGNWVDPSGTEQDANDSASVTTQGIAANAGVSTTANRPSQPVALDQVIPDDLIVQGSICAGFDCVNNESFGVDTLRLKENNLRINFDDTSTSAGYANNDWRIGANDQPSGGANKFYVEDSTAGRNPFTIEAAAPANALYVDSTGNIGMQNSAPGLDFHMTESDTPAIRLEQTNAGGFTAQTWDIGGNEANFFIRDLTGGSRLSFRIRPGAPTSSIDIAATGNVGVGTANPAMKLDVFGTSTASTESGIRVRGSSSDVEIGDIFMTNTGALTLSTVNGTGSQSYIELRPEDDQYGMVLRNSTGAATFPYANFYVTDAATDYLTIDVNAAKTGAITLWSDGKVGIGTTAPSEKLTVQGNVRVNGGAFIDDGVTLTAPDYVFEDSYKLMSIPEVASFIKQNKHLPNVPSAKDIKTNGLNISKFQMALLEKVEELTLYTVDQHEQISTLKAQNDKLLERLSALEQKLAETNQ